MHRLPSRLAGTLIAIAIGALALPSGAAGQSARASDHGAAGSRPIRLLHDRATVDPLPPFVVRPFAVSSATIRTLAWSDLPMNGLHILGLGFAALSDAQGIPYKVIDGRLTYSPGNIGSDGLRYLDAYVRTGDPAYLDRAVVRAQKLVSLSQLSGEARFIPYDYDYDAEHLVAPWSSAYSQGFALSLFVRLYRVTGDQAWADLARETAMSFRQLGRSGGPWVAYVRQSRLWLEEYPSATPTHVLNGMDFAMFGLYDYERLTRDPAADDLLRGALLTIRTYGMGYRVPGGISRYDLVHHTHLAHYHLIHIWQLEDLTAMSGDPWYADLAALLWADYH